MSPPRSQLTRPPPSIIGPYTSSILPASQHSSTNLPSLRPGSYLVFTPERAIKYRSTWISLIICMIVTSLLSLVLRFILERENARRDAAARGESKEEAINDLLERQEEMDMTDGENKEFRYSL
jgi:hypothetical protein